jgi:hypothetical protein
LQKFDFFLIIYGNRTIGANLALLVVNFFVDFPSDFGGDDAGERSMATSTMGDGQEVEP